MTYAGNLSTLKSVMDNPNFRFVKADICDKESLKKVFDNEKFDGVIHFAGLKAVGESVQKPMLYYKNNIAGTLNLLEVMGEHGCKNIIFSSSATVYGDPAFVPITEECPKGTCTNPYGWTKSMIEQIMMDVQKADNEWNIALLRSFLLFHFLRPLRSRPLRRSPPRLPRRPLLLRRSPLPPPRPRALRSLRVRAQQALPAARVPVRRRQGSAASRLPPAEKLIFSWCFSML